MNQAVKEFFKTKGIYVGAGLLVVIGAIVLWSTSSIPGMHHSEYDENFYVAALDFGGDGKYIYVNFSQPVDADKLSDFFEISPVVKGKFEQSSPTEVRFTPEGLFGSGINYSVVIKAGLTSHLGSQIREDFSKVLYLNFSADDFKVLKNNKYSLLQSVYIEDLQSLRAQVGGSVDNPSLKIFKANNPESLIKDVISGDPYSYGYQKPEYKTDLSNLTLVTEQKNVANNTQVQIPKEVGVYLIQALQNETIASRVWVTVNTMGIHFRQDDQKFLLAAQDLKTGAPVSGVELTTYDTGDKNLSQLGKLTFSGLAEFPYVYPRSIDIAVAKKGSEYAFIPVNVQGSLAELRVYQNLTDTWQGFVYTDRPIYKPVDSIKFRGILRRDNDGQFLLPPSGTEVKVSLRSNDYLPNLALPEQTLTVNQYGVYFGEFNLSGSIPSGKYYLDIQAPQQDGYAYGGQAWFEILEYKKPPFELKVEMPKDEYTEGDVIKVKLKGSNFSGQAFGKQKVTYKVFAMDYYETEKAVYNKSFALNGWGGMCGGGIGFDAFNTYYGEPIAGTEQEVTLNSNGEIEMSFDTRKLERNISQQLAFVAEKKDANGNLITDAKTAIVHNGEINIFVRAFKNQPRTAQAPTAVFSAETQSGEKLANREFDYAIEQVKYDYANGASQRIKKSVKTGKVKTNAEGIGEFKVEGLSEMEEGYNSVEVSVITQDGRGNRIVGSQNLYAYARDYQYEQPVLLNITSTETNLQPGSRAKLKIHSPEDMRVLLAFERGRVYDSQWLNLKAGENIYEFTVKDEYMPTITPTFSAFYKNHYYVEGLTFNVPAMKKLQNISVTTDKQEYQQGQITKVTIKVTDSEGRPEQTQLSLGVIDKAIFALRKSTQLPLHSTFYYFRPRRTNNSSSMTGLYGDGAEQGGGGDGGGGLSGKDVDVLYWNPDLQTDASGEVVIYIPVEGNTVWKGIIYSSDVTTDLGQAEFEFSSK